MDLYIITSLIICLSIYSTLQWMIFGFIYYYMFNYLSIHLFNSMMSRFMHFLCYIFLDNDPAA